MIFVADLPPPIHGMSFINKEFYGICHLHLENVKLINTSSGSKLKLKSNLIRLSLKATHLLVCFFKLFLISIFNTRDVLYRPIYGGKGQIFDLVFLIIAKLFKHQVYIHHHSYQYINNPNLLTALLFRISIKNTIHITLSDSMGKRLSTIYNIELDNILTISNISFFESALTEVYSSKKITIGHLANLCFDKGLDSFVEVCEALNEYGLVFEATLAGPCVSDEVRKFVMDATTRIPNLSYIGSVYGEDKERFFESLDCFIFLSRYSNEAEPLVLYEAAQKANFLIGTEKGCMGNVISYFNGLVVTNNTSNIDLIVNFIMNNREVILSDYFKRKRLASFNSKQLESKTQLSNLVKDIEKNEIPEP